MGGGTTGSGSSPSNTRSSSGFYGGGSRTPFRAGIISPLGVSGFYIPPFEFWKPYYWGSQGAYYYRLDMTAPALLNNTAHNETDPVICVCQKYQLCGCDNADGNYTLPNDILYGVINGTEYVIINGTLENGTDISGSSPGMGLFLTKSGAWGSWLVFGVATMLALQILL